MDTSRRASPHRSGGASGLFPMLSWLRGYSLTWLRSDLVAGVTLAAYAVPVALAYATLAGLPPQVGVYGYMLGGHRLCAARFVASSRDRADLGDLAHAGGQCRCHGGRRSRALRGNREPRRLRGRAAVPGRLGAAAQRADEAHQRQHPGRLQGRRRHHHRHDPAAGTVRGCRRRAECDRARGACWPVRWRGSARQPSRSASPRSGFSSRAVACCLGDPSRLGWWRWRSW